MFYRACGDLPVFDADCAACHKNDEKTESRAGDTRLRFAAQRKGRYADDGRIYFHYPGCRRNPCRRIREVVGYEGEIRFNADKPDGTMRKLTDVSKLHALGWHHKIEIEEGVQKMYDWYIADHTDLFR
ncbi:MAG: hypothetical protein BHV68_04865 [Bacteroidales bacterium 43_8]|nr:MAG: hypothetical protein BHV68_04865 [Bacteroidales bacterium 43_8]